MMDLFFDLLNFLILLVVIVYAFRRWGIDALHSLMVQEQVALTNIDRRNDALMKREQFLIAAKGHQADLYRELSKKVAQWRRSVDQEHVIQEQERELRSQQIDDYYQQQSDMAMQQKEHCQVIVRAVALSREQLKAFFEDPRHQQNYLEKITDFMKESS